MVMKKYQLALFLTAVLALAGIELVSASTYSVTVAQANQTQAAGVFYMAPNGDDTRTALPSPLLGKPAIINCRAVLKFLCNRVPFSAISELC